MNTRPLRCVSALKQEKEVWIITGRNTNTEKTKVETLFLVIICSNILEIGQWYCPKQSNYDKGVGAHQWGGGVSVGHFGPCLFMSRGVEDKGKNHAPKLLWSRKGQSSKLKCLSFTINRSLPFIMTTNRTFNPVLAARGELDVGHKLQSLRIP